MIDNLHEMAREVGAVSDYEHDPHDHHAATATCVELVCSRCEIEAAALTQLRALRKACAEVAAPPSMERAYAINTAAMWSRDAGRRIAAAILALGEKEEGK